MEDRDQTILGTVKEAADASSERESYLLSPVRFPEPPRDPVNETPGLPSGKAGGRHDQMNAALSFEGPVRQDRHELPARAFHDRESLCTDHNTHSHERTSRVEPACGRRGHPFRRDNA
jgi:hypothetical protein